MAQAPVPARMHSSPAFRKFNLQHQINGDQRVALTTKDQANCEPKLLNNRKPKTENRKRVYTVSLGCPKNLVDTEIMLGGLTRAGWEVTGDACGRRSPAGQYLRLHRAGL